MPRRNGPENSRILKEVVGYSTVERSSWILTVEEAVGFSTVEACGWVFRISTGRDELRS